MFNSKPKTAIYVRVSTEEQAKEGISISAQIDRCQNYCKARNWKVVNVYTDAGYSAGTMNRPAVKQLIDDLNKNKFENILVHKFDRFSRNVRDLITFLDNLKEKKVNFTSVTENIDTTTAMGEAFFQMIGVFAQLERGMVKERVKLAFDKKAHDGEVLNRAPLGYKYKKGRLTIDEKNSKKIKTIFNMRSAGVHYKEISERTEVPISTLYNILKNPTYVGKVKYNGEIYEGTHPAIIEATLFNRINPLENINSNTLKEWV